MRFAEERVTPARLPARRLPASGRASLSMSGLRVPTARGPAVWGPAWPTGTPLSFLKPGLRYRFLHLKAGENKFHQIESSGWRDKEGKRGRAICMAVTLRSMRFKRPAQRCFFPSLVINKGHKSTIKAKADLL